MGGKGLAYAGLVCAVLVLVGSVGPWVTAFGFIEVSGTEGDGMITLVLALVAGLLIGWRVASGSRWPRFLAGLAFLAVAGIGVYDWSELERNIDEADEDVRAFVDAAVSVGWGLVLTTFAGVAGLIVTVLDAARPGSERIWGEPVARPPLPETQLGYRQVRPPVPPAAPAPEAAPAVLQDDASAPEVGAR